MICRFGRGPSRVENKGWTIFFLGEGGGGLWTITKKNSCTAKVEKKNHAQLAKGRKN